MAERLRFLPAGTGGLLVELENLEGALALFDGLNSARPEGVLELVPAARTVLIRFDERVTDRDILAALICRIDLSAPDKRSGETFDIPVTYDGEDLGDVADMLGWTVDEVVRRHTEAEFTVAFTGFAPGFAYMTSNDPGFDVPRRKSPRTRIPAGSVAIAGKFGGIYPSDSPGGWQLLGRTAVKMWDPTRQRAALLTPGDRVRFVDMAKGVAIAHASAPIQPPEKSLLPDSGLRVTRADRPALYQDLGRRGRADQGVSVSGAVDRAALRRANISVGNPRDTAALEITFGGFALRTDRPITLAATGASSPLHIRSADGRQLTAPFGRAFALDAGDELSLGIPAEGMRTYLALRGGFSVETVLGSASTDTLARIGPAPIVAGHVLVPADRPAVAVAIENAEAVHLPSAGETVTLDVLPGPRTDWFTDRGVETFFSQDWQVTAETSRIGIRLGGAASIERRDSAELASEATVQGAIQVPHSGQPVVFLADHPLTGGYPVIGVIADYHLDLAGQIPIGARIRFNAISAFDPIVRNIDR